MTLIICAIKPEIKPFLEALENERIEECDSLDVHHGVINGANVMVVRCGAGLEKAAAATQALIEKFQISCMIMSGTAGGVDRELNIGDTIISEEMLYHEGKTALMQSDTSFTKDKLFKADENLLINIKKSIENDPLTQAVYFGRITSGSKFVTGKKFKTVAEKYNPLCVDMETAAVAHVCAINNIPFIAVRSVTDTPKKSGLLNFYKNVVLAANNSFVVVERLLKELETNNTCCL